jgi:hypothetical protein
MSTLQERYKEMIQNPNNPNIRNNVKVPNTSSNAAQALSNMLSSQPNSGNTWTPPTNVGITSPYNQSSSQQFQSTPTPTLPTDSSNIPTPNPHSYTPNNIDNNPQNITSSIPTKYNPYQGA